MNIKLMASSVILYPGWCSSNPSWHIPAFLNLGTLNSTKPLLLGVISDSEITNKRQKNEKKCAVNRLQKGHLFAVWELKQEGIALPCLTSAGACVPGDSELTALCVSWMTMEASPTGTVAAHRESGRMPASGFLGGGVLGGFWIYKWILVSRQITNTESANKMICTYNFWNCKITQRKQTGLWSGVL